MAEGKRLSMRQARAIFRLKFEAGLSHDQVARACQVSKGVVAKYARRARELGLSKKGQVLT